MKKNSFPLLLVIALVAISCGKSYKNPLDEIDLIPLGNSFYSFEGKKVIDGDGVFREVDFFSDGLALVFLKGGGAAYIDKDGKVVIESEGGTHSSGFWNGVAFKRVMRSSDKKELTIAFDTSGKELFSTEAEPITMFNAKGKALFKIAEDEYSLCDKSGKMTKVQHRDDCRWIHFRPSDNNFVLHSDIMMFSCSHGIGIMDTEGKILIEPGQDDYQSGWVIDCNGNIMTYKCENDGNKYYLLNKNGEVLFETFRYTIDCDVDRYLCTHYDGSKRKTTYFWCNEKGDTLQKLVETDYESYIRPYYLGGEYAIYQDNNYRWNCLDRKGMSLPIPCDGVCSPLLGGKVYVIYSLKDGKYKYHLMTADGDIIYNTVGSDIYHAEVESIGKRLAMNDNYRVIGEHRISRGQPYVYVWWE